MDFLPYYRSLPISCRRLFRTILALCLTSSASFTAAFCQQHYYPPAGGNGLPPCNLDSFVYQSGAQAEYIYGDEGHGTKPRLAGFTKASRIDAGITDQRDAGLTTGHGSYMPCAWGADEFIQGPSGEWGQSGARGDTPLSGMDGSVVFEPPDHNAVIGLPNSAAGSTLIPVPQNPALQFLAIGAQLRSDTKVGSSQVNAGTETAQPAQTTEMPNQSFNYSDF